MNEEDLVAHSNFTFTSLNPNQPIRCQDINPFVFVFPVCMQKKKWNASQTKLRDFRSRFWIVSGNWNVRRPTTLWGFQGSLRVESFRLARTRPCSGICVLPIYSIFSDLYRTKWLLSALRRFADLVPSCFAFLPFFAGVSWYCTRSSVELLGRSS